MHRNILLMSGAIFLALVLYRTYLLAITSDAEHVTDLLISVVGLSLAAVLLRVMARNKRAEGEAPKAQRR